ncbi:arginine--tRNA ligase [Bacteriovoracaceae bacterium]|nr:arginine--tRNA ligase [Bacteriovoracaceae bacterium]
MKKNNFDPLKQTILELVNQCLSADNKQDPDQMSLLYTSIAAPPKANMGHLAFPCFEFAKSLRKSPVQIAQEFSKKLEKIISQESFKNKIENITPAGPYLNFSFTSEFLFLSATKLNQDLFINKEQKLIDSSEKVMIEYSQPNTHKELHVGHMRNLCLGNALCKIFKFSGLNTTTSTFPGDVGTHVAKTLWYLEHRYEGDINQENNLGTFLGGIYSLANTTLNKEKEFPEKFEANKKVLTEILQQLHGQKGHYYDLWVKTREWSIDLMKQVYQWADVTFDRWFFESEVDASSLKLVNKFLEKGLFIKDQGAIGINLEDDKLGFCLLIKSDGNGLYATKDLELARRKFEEFNIDKNIYIVDNRQSLHFKQVFKTLDKMGFKQAKDCYHLPYEFVELPDGAMSSRSGNIVPLEDLISKMEEHLSENYLSKYNDELSSDEISELASTIAAGAIKFGMNAVDPQKKIIFKMDEWLKIEGESGPYIQYVYARIQAIFRKNKVNPNELNITAEQITLDEDVEKQLLLSVIELPSVIQKIPENYRTNTLCHHLYQIAKLYNSFYASCPIKDANENVKLSRMALCKLVAESIKTGLDLLGIKAPERM